MKKKQEYETRNTSLLIARIVFSTLFLVGIILFLITIDLSTLTQTLENINFWLIPVSILIILASLLLKSIRLKILCNQPGSINSFFQIQTLSIFFATITPGRSGELIKVYFLKQKGFNALRSVGIFLTERICDFIILGFVGLEFYAIYILKNPTVAKIILASAIFAYCVFFFLRKIVKFEKIKLFSGYLFPDNKSILIVFILSTIIWILEGFSFMIVLLMLGKNISFFVAIGIMSISAISSIFTVLPLGIGPVDLSAGYLLSTQGIQSTTIVAFLILLRVIVVLTLGTLGLIIINIKKLNVLELIKQSKKIKNEEKKS